MGFFQISYECENEILDLYDRGASRPTDEVTDENHLTKTKISTTQEKLFQMVLTSVWILYQLDKKLIKIGTFLGGRISTKIEVERSLLQENISRYGETKQRFV